jgi:uncharacterized protein (TIGR03067 family)
MGMTMSRARAVPMIVVSVFGIVIVGAAYRYYARSPASLEGNWRAVAVETDGVSPPADFATNTQWRFEKGFLMIKGITPTGEVPCSVTLNQNVKPWTLDYQGIGTKHKVLGIYELRGDRLEVCIITHPRERPTAFKTEPGSNLTRISFVRD